MKSFTTSNYYTIAMKPIFYIFICLYLIFLVGCSSNENAYQKHLSRVTMQNADFLRAHGFVVTKVDSRTGTIQVRKGGVTDNLTIHYPTDSSNTYVAENWTLFSPATPSASVTSYWMGR